jgi:hypothetical protein
MIFIFHGWLSTWGGPQDHEKIFFSKPYYI